MQDLILISRVETLFSRIYPALKNFPKSERYCLTSRYKEAFLEMIKYLSMGSSVQSKRFYYYSEADGQLKLIKFLTRFSNNQRYLSNGFYQTIDTELTHIENILSALIRNHRK